MAPKRLVLFTFAIFVLILALGCFFNKPTLPDAITLKVDGQPTIGYPKAKVHVVVFEEPKCVNCREFSEEIYPLLKKDYIDTNKITYTVVPVSFLPGSMPASNALLCTYYSDPVYPNNELFFTYLKYIYAHQPDEHTDWATTEKLLEFAKEASPAIDLSKLQKCIDHETYRVQVEKNNAFGKSIMGGVLSTPTMYINGIEVKQLDYSSVEELIKKLLEKEGLG